MAETGTPGQPAGNGAGGESLGDLVSLAVKDVSQLIKWEIDLAKLELRDDVKRLGISGAMLGIAGFVGCMVIVLVSFAAAYALMTAGLPGWAAFLSVAGVYVLIAAAAILVGVTKMRRLTGLRRTRASVQGSLAALRSDGDTGSGGQGAS
jgi:uncharacterized membrane protein YqjE